MPNSKNTTPQLTVGEKAQLAWLVARMAKRGLADPDRTGTGAVDLSDLQRRADRIYALVFGLGQDPVLSAVATAEPEKIMQ